MKWNETKPSDIRVKKFFAFFPVTIGFETRWWEAVIVRQKFTVSNENSFFAVFHETPRWHNLEFLTEEEYVQFQKSAAV